MLPTNRLFTPAELQALSRLAPGDVIPTLPADRGARRPVAGGWSLMAQVQRLVVRVATRRAAPPRTA
jgi:hypothetical protein